MKMAKFATTISRIFIQNRLLSTLRPQPEILPFTVKYLMESCGLSLESAFSASMKIKIQESHTKNPNAVLAFLKSHGFDDNHVAALISRKPSLLVCRIDQTLKPKIEFFVKNGFKESLLHRLIVKNPIILNRSLSAHITPTFNFLKTYLRTFDELSSAVTRSVWLLTTDHEAYLKPNLDLLLSEGVSVERIAKLLLFQPRAALLNPKKMIAAVESVKGMGMETDSLMFIHALRVVLSMNELNWKKKVDVFKSLGWSEEDILSTFRRDPTCLATSEEKLRRVMDYYVNTVKIDRDTIIRYPKLLTFGLDTRIRPRHKVIETLQSKKLLKEGTRIAWILTLGEKIFLERYVIKNMDQAPELLETYRGSIGINRQSNRKKGGGDVYVIENLDD